MTEKSKMDIAFERKGIYMIMSPDDMNKYLMHNYRYYPATDQEFDGIGYFKFMMVDENTTPDDLSSAQGDATKFSNGFNIGINVVINVEPAIYELHKNMIDEFISKNNLLDPYIIERRGKPQEKWNHKIALTEEEIGNMFESCKNDRDRFLVNTLFYTSMRINELIAMKKEWFTIEKDLMMINVPAEDDGFKPKSAAGERTIYITNKTAISIIDNWFENNESYGRSDVTAWKRCVAIAKDAGITHRVTPHILRHSGISRWAYDGIPVNLICAMAGHTNISFTISHYVHQIKDATPAYFRK